MSRMYFTLLKRVWLVLLGLCCGTSLSVAQQITPPKVVSLNITQVRQQLSLPTGTNARPGATPTFQLNLPTLQGNKDFVLTETHVLPATDTAAHRRLRTFVGYQQDNVRQRIALVLTPQELTAHLLAGSEAVGLRRAPGSARYLLSPEQRQMGPCTTLSPTSELLKPDNFSTLPAPFRFGTQLRRIRYAILVTQEYYTANGNTDAAVELAVVAAMNQMSGLYLRELSVSYELVRPSSSTYYFSAMTTATLPGEATATPGRLRQQALGDVGSLINERFTPSDFDLGHCFHSGGGGVAYVGVICNSTYKAQAWSGVGTSGFQGVLAHEMGHQHGAAHTFAGPCGVASTSSNLEPGGGATIMAYTDVCGSQTLQNVVGTEADHFNLRSLDQMRARLVAVTCPTVASNPNQPPTVSAGADYVIPRNTPFTLTASGSDPDGETLYYTWNQFDYTANSAALGTIVGSGGLAAVDDPEAPLFRPRPPRVATSRTFPDVRYVLANSNQPPNLIGEALPNVAREIHFAVTARDQRASGGTFATDNVTLTVAPDTGPFALTCQNTDPALWIAGQPATITWSVNGTDLAPIAVQQVRISLSTDGGQTFGTVLAAAAPNNGTATVQVPTLTTNQARIRVEAVGNVFFDINDSDFPISACLPVASQTLPATALTAAAGDAALALDQQAYSLTEYVGANQIKGTVLASDPTSYLTDYDGSSCRRYGGNITYYKAHVFVPSVTGTYRIDMPTRFTSTVLRVYAGNSFDASNPCNNLLADNYTGGLARDVTVALTAGQPYTLVVSTFGGAPAANSNYSISFTSSAAGATVYAPLQNLGYEYQYVVVNIATQKIARLAPTADLRSLPAGTYDVYGMLLQRGYPTASLQLTSLSTLEAALSQTAPCGQLSSNARRVTITGTVPLPVVLTRFTAQPAGTSNTLSWTTASETQVAHFEVQRSPNGLDFTGIGRVAATNTRNQHAYSLTDASPLAGLNYYRLLVQDVDGQTTYSAVVAVQSSQAFPALHVMAYPNPVPAGAALQLKLQARHLQTVELTLTNTVGTIVAQRILALPAGETTILLPETLQEHGLHILTVQSPSGGRHWQKIVLE